MQVRRSRRSRCNRRSRRGLHSRLPQSPAAQPRPSYRCHHPTPHGPGGGHTSPRDTPHGEQRSRAAAEGYTRCAHLYDAESYDHVHTRTPRRPIRARSAPEGPSTTTTPEHNNKKRASAQTAPQRGCTRGSAARYTRNEGICTRYEQEQWPRPPGACPYCRWRWRWALDALLYCPAAYNARDYVRRLLCLQVSTPCCAV